MRLSALLASIALFAALSCATPSTTLHISPDHPASPDGVEARPPNWTSLLPLAEGAGETSDTTPSHEDSQAPQSTGTGKPLYTCPMHAQIVRDKPGNCPICEMKLVLKKTAENEHGGHP